LLPFRRRNTQAALRKIKIRVAFSRKPILTTTASRRPKAWESVLKLNLILSLAAFLQVIPLATTFANAQSGVASIYSNESGSRTASGARLNPGALTAAHRSLPFGSRVRVTNGSNGRSVVVTINDRGPFARGRIIDVTPAAAHALGFSGIAPVTIERE
jgi:rare lipoprotein A